MPIGKGATSTIPSISRTAALIVVDVQVDFCPGGALAVPEGDRVVPVLNAYIEKFRSKGASIAATRDWHPSDHRSFKPFGGIWPPHCIQDSPGARFHSDLRLPSPTYVVSKAADPEKDAYSGFQGTDLAAWLAARRITTVFIGGLATDYCVKSTVLDAIRAGFQAVYLADASRAVNLSPGDGERAEEEMARAGAVEAGLQDIV